MEECFFSESYDNLLKFTPTCMSKLQEEFIDYQLLDQKDIPDLVWKEALVRESDDEDESVQYFGMDIIWGYISTLKNVVDHLLEMQTTQ